LTFAVSANSQSPSKKARKYLAKVFDLVESNYYYIDSIDINSLKAKCYALISNAQTQKDTYPAIDTLLRNLFDPHHIFLKPAQFSKITYFDPLKFSTVELIDSSVGYIKIPSLIGHYNEWQWWSDSLQTLMTKIQNPDIKGWVIDLRGNKGGDFTPIITSIYPFFGDTTVFTLKDRSNNLKTYKYSSGFFANESGTKITKLLPYKKGLVNAKKCPVAVLIDNKSASSAEMVAIAFKGRAKTTFFGEPTAGLTIFTDGFTLSDKAYITVAIGKFYDTKGISYEHSINPDVFIKQEPDKTDKTKQMAIDWLRKQ
jgi:carboxyl-terminal processing protease